MAKKVVLLGISSVLLVAMVIAVAIGMGGENEDLDQNGMITSKKAIRDICQTTDYQKSCVSSLTSNAGNATDPKELIKIAFEVAITEFQEAVNNSELVDELGNDPKSLAALNDCKEMSDIAANDLKRAIDKFNKFDLTTLDQLIADIRIWLSGSITYQETCLNGFEDIENDSVHVMKKVLNVSMELSSNALAMITEISAVLTSFENPSASASSNRRLLSVGPSPILGHDDLFPGWIEVGKERLLFAQPGEIKADLVVAKDGSGNFKTIKEALNDVPKKSKTTFVIYIKEGVYKDKVEIKSHMTHVMIIGDGPNKTRITGKLNYKDGTSTYHTATVVVHGDNFFARDIGFENTAGPEKHQAVALRVSADKAIFLNCQMDGYQDTLYVHTYRQFYRNCVVSGTIDFIFGDSSAILQNCTLVIRKPMENQKCIVTAQGRKEVRQPTGLVLQNCTFMADPEYEDAVKDEFKAYLGRPWKEYSRTVIMESYIGDLIHPDGWMKWNDTFALKTLFYTEFNNRGPGAPKKDRIKWPGIKELTTDRIKRFTAAKFLEGDKWIPSTGVPYNGGLIFAPPSEQNDTNASPNSREEGIDINIDKEKIEKLYQPFLNSVFPALAPEGSNGNYDAMAPSPQTYDPNFSPTPAPAPAPSPISDMYYL